MTIMKPGLNKYVFLVVKLFCIAILLFFAVLPSCSRRQEPPKPSPGPAGAMKSEESRQRTDSTRQESQSQKDGMRKPHSVTDPRADRRKIVKQGEIVFETSDPNSTRNLIERLVKETQGYISEDAQNKTDNEVRTRVIIRVPAENFDELVKLIIAGVPYVEKKFITASDITEDYIDIEARIRTQKELELRYIELLKQARKMEDIIGINQELTNVRENIESTQGKLKHLAHCVAYSFLTIEYYQQSTSVSRFFGKIWQGMKSGWKYFAIFIIGLAQVWPFLVIAVIVVFIIRARKKKSAQKLS